uniref:Integrase catalytic domain-containing protein n=1 Tax=Nicotiana tabacum TaxID=4097 RepID=A0A1S4C1E3_TOBAC
MDFVVSLPRTRLKHDSIWMIVDRLTKSVHFLPVKMTDTAPRYAKLYLKEIVRLHSIPAFIIFDRGAQFTAHFWQSFQEGLGTSVNLSAVFHSQTGGQAERTIQMLEDMLRACMAPYEALYDRHCRSPIGWFEPTEVGLLGLDLVHDALEKVALIQQRLKNAQSGQKSYTYVHRRKLEFKEGDQVFLKDWEVAYKLELPALMTLVHPVFHVSMLRGYVPNPTHIVSPEVVEINDGLTYEEELVEILDRQ